MSSAYNKAWAALLASLAALLAVYHIPVGVLADPSVREWAASLIVPAVSAAVTYFVKNKAKPPEAPPAPILPSTPKASLLLALALIPAITLGMPNGSAHAAPRAVAAKPAVPSLATLLQQLNSQFTAVNAALTGTVGVIQGVTVEDLQGALADANANGDTIGAACWSALIPYVQSNLANPLPANVGAFTLLQKARDVKKLVTAGIPTAIQSGCAPVVLDAQNTLIQLGLMTGTTLLK